MTWAFPRATSIAWARVGARAASRSRAGSGVPEWTDDYPAEFRDRLPANAGYAFEPGDASHRSGFYVLAECVGYDFQLGGGSRRGLPLVTRHPLGTDDGERDTRVDYDAFGLFPVSHTDPLGLATTARHDYRAFQARLTVDANGRRTVFAFTPLGLPERSALLGSDAAPTGDSLQRPGVLLSYDFGGRDPGTGERRPAAVRTVRRVHHRGAPPEDGQDPDEVLESVSYSDGWGRVVQVRSRSEAVLFGNERFGGHLLSTSPDDPGPTDLSGRLAALDAVVVSGARRFDNKGRTVEVFEPYFDTGTAYRPADGPSLGQRSTTVYDALGRVVRTVCPDGSEHRIVPGVPRALDDPDAFVPTPWEAFSYDADDNAGRTHPAGTQDYRHQWDTPSSTVVDAFGRTVSVTVRQRMPGDAVSAPRELTTRFDYDLRDDLLRVTDALGRVAHRFVRDVGSRVVERTGLDSGVRRTFCDAAGDEIERRDERGALAVQAHDLGGRRCGLWARDAAGTPVTLRERLEYGDGGTPEQPTGERAANRAAHRLGVLATQYDESGRIEFVAYDGEGHVVERRRQVIADAPVADALRAGAPLRIDWEPPAGMTPAEHATILLETDAHTVSFRFDAVDRVQAMRFPEDAEGGRRVLRLHYGRSGTVERVLLDDRPVVEHVAYDARGQQVFTAFGNGALTLAAHDVPTNRLVRLRTQRFTRPDPSRYVLDGEPVQDVEYSYDLAGNVIGEIDRAAGSGVRGNPAAAAVADPRLRARLVAGDALLREFTYDALHQLVTATGRERAGAGPNPASPDNASAVSALYTERYTYDDAGNLTRLRHAGADGATVRRFVPVEGRDRLNRVVTGGTTIPFEHDRNGNLVRTAESRRMGWNHADRLVSLEVRAGEGPPPLVAGYLYDAEGERVKKVVLGQDGRVASTTYVDGVFERHRFTDAGVERAGDELHVEVSERRVATFRVGPARAGDNSPAVQYVLPDRLGNVGITLDGDGAFVDREEYTPYGATSMGSVARKRYRFRGRERDEESGLYYVGARYYAPDLARWLSPDPLGFSGDPNPYAYCRSSPMTRSDPAGLDSGDTISTVTTAGGRTYGGSPEGGFARVDYESVLLGSEQAWKDGSIDWDFLLRSSDEVIEVQGRPTQTINGNIFSDLDGEYWMLLAGESSPHRLSKDAYDNAVVPSRTIEAMTDDQLRSTFGAVEALGGFMEKATLIGLNFTPAGRATLSVMGVMDSAVAYSRAESASDRAWAVVSAMASLPLPGVRGPAPVAATEAAQELRAVTAVSRAVQAGEPDVYAISLVRWKKVAGAGRGVGEEDRRMARGIAGRAGQTGPVDVGHAPGSEHVFSRPGDTIWLRAEPSGPNRRAGALLRPEVARVRANPGLGIFARPKRR